MRTLESFPSKIQDGITGIAKVCHQANKAYCESIGDMSQQDWEHAPAWQRESAVKGVLFHIGDGPFSPHPKMEESSSHNSWMVEKLKNGWKYGETKDADAKTHPCLLPYEYLPKSQKLKDHIFESICQTMIRWSDLNDYFRELEESRYFRELEESRYREEKSRMMANMMEVRA